MNKTPIKKLIFWLIIFSAFITALCVALQLLFPKYASPAIPYILVFFFLLTFFTIMIVSKKPQSATNKKFIINYMVTRVVKNFSMLVFLVLYLIFNKDDRWNFAGAFLIIYFLYSAFEIVALKKEQ
jgi:L-asparagine transporter-like permease